MTNAIEVCHGFLDKGEFPGPAITYNLCSASAHLKLGSARRLGLLRIPFVWDVNSEAPLFTLSALHGVRELVITGPYLFLA